MRKLLALISTITTVSAIILAAPVSAHILADDGNIGAILHIDPDDDPIAGQQAHIYFEFEDKQNQFQPQNCNCQVSITEERQQIFSQTLPKDIPMDDMSGNGDFSFTFPKEDVYQLTLSGQPTTTNEFQPFTVSFDIRVDRTANTASSNISNSQNNHILEADQSPSLNSLYILAGAAGVIVLFGLSGSLWLKLKSSKRIVTPATAHAAQIPEISQSTNAPKS